MRCTFSKSGTGVIWGVNIGGGCVMTGWGAGVVTRLRTRLWGDVLTLDGDICARDLDVA